MIPEAGLSVRLSTWILLLAIASPGVPQLHAQEPFEAWVGLYGAAPLGRLENENRLSELCVDPETMSRCYREKMAPSIVTSILYEGPDTESLVVGELLVVVVPGRGLSAFYRSTESTVAPVIFTPDLFLQDWGYGPYFHQTIAERRGDWFKLPGGPWPGPVWIHEPGDTAPVLSVHAGDIIDFKGIGWYVVSSAKDSLVLRPEQPGDMWCHDGDPPPVEGVQPKRFSRADLLDAGGHLVIRSKYLKGC
jgi:hypothetical protein